MDFEILDQEKFISAEKTPPRKTLEIKKKSVEKKYDLFDILSFLSSNLCNDYSSEEVGKKYGLKYLK